MLVIFSYLDSLNVHKEIKEFFFSLSFFVMCGPRLILFSLA